MDRSLRLGGRVDDDITKELVNRLVINGDFEPAWTLYSKLKPSEATSRFAVRDPRVRGAAHAMAFDWQLANTSDSFFTPSLNGKPAYFRSFASDQVVIAYQLLLLRPSKYQLSSKTNLTTGDNAKVAWTLNCAGSDREISRTPIIKSGTTDTILIPSNCPAQWLRLVVASPGAQVIGGSVESVDLHLASTTSREAGSSNAAGLPE